MTSLHRTFIGLGWVACAGLVSCASSVDGDNPALQQAALSSNNQNKGGAATVDLSLSMDSLTGSAARGLHPVLNCVAPRGAGNLVAYFGYDNPEHTTLTVPVGPRNRFLPPPSDRGQPTRFAPGVSNNVVSIAFNAGGLVQWDLGQTQAVASKRSPPCVPVFAGATHAMVVSDSEITLIWEPATDYTTPAAGIRYDICASTTSGSCASHFVIAQTTAGGATLATVTGLHPSTAYYFVVRARNKIGSEDANTVEVGAQTCVTGQQACNGSCTSLASDPANCGMCGDVCATGLCGSGLCCSTGQSLCNGMCTSLASDPANCGTCGNVCASGLCTGGQCCSSGQAVCDGSCTSLASDPANCGACGNQCPDGDACSAGQCCPVGQNACNGLCTDPLTDPRNCGSCSNTCASGFCVGGQCCSTTQSACNGTCTSLASDAANCGVCGNLCSSGNVCTAGQCAAPMPVAVAAGAYHTCAVLMGGTVECWGANTYGQLGNGTTTSSSTPVPVTGLSGVTAIATGGVHTCALLKGGTARCWGANGFGQLGNGTTTSSSTPVPVAGLSGVTAIAAGGSSDVPIGHTCALISDGSVECWGYNGSGELGNGTITNSSTPVAVSGLSGATAIAAGEYHTCALLMGGTVECWGDDEYLLRSSTPVVVPGLSNATAFVVGYEHWCALLTDRTAKCGGFNFGGELGNGTATNATTPVAVFGLKEAASIAAGYRDTCALLTNGTVDCWGSDYYGELGNGTTSTCLTPVAVSGLGGATAIAAGYFHTCALLMGDTVECWGENNYGQLGNGTTINSLRPLAVQGLSCGAQPCCSTGLTYCGGICTLLDTDSANCGACGNQCPSGTACFAGQCNCSIGQSWCNGSCSWPLSDSANCGACGNQCPSGTACSAAQCCPTGQVSCNGTCTSLTTDSANCGLCGNVCPSGLCAAGQCCSIGQAVCNGTCTSLASDPANCGACGNVCASGTCSAGSCYCSATCNGVCAWIEGDPANCGACGNQCPDSNLCTAGKCVDSGAVPVAVAAGGQHTCALQAGGTIECWGDNTYGQLGNGTTTNSLTPTVVPGVSGATALDAGSTHTCALLSDGTVECWGNNVDGQLASATVLYSAVPLPILALPPATAVAAGGNHTCAALSDGMVECWGYNNYGQLGIATSTASTATPVVVQGISDAVLLSAGTYGTCATRVGGALSCWGYDATTTIGSIGLPVAAASATPVSRAGSGIAGVSVGEYHTCYVATGGGVTCWGGVGLLGNASSEVGLHTFIAGYYMASPDGLPLAKSVSAGDSHTCALTKFGQVETWGPDNPFVLGHSPCDVTDTFAGISISVPCPVAIAASIAVTAGSQHSCAILKDHSISCWGYNSSGQLGDGTTTNSSVPVVTKL